MKWCFIVMRRYYIFSFLRILWIINLWSVETTLLVNGQEPCPGIWRNGLCYYVRQAVASWEEGDVTCQANGGGLAAILDQDIQNAIVELLQREHVILAWAGGLEAVEQWKWASNGIIVAPQGCYFEREIDPDLPVQISGSDVTIETCVERCFIGGFEYAGMKEGSRCSCGTSFGKYGTTDQCITACTTPSSISNWCGGTGRNFVYNVTGPIISWGFNQPNDFQFSQRCGCMDSALEYKFADETCGKRFIYLCSVPMMPCSAPGYISLNQGHCLFISELVLSWHYARTACQSLGGDLLYVQNKDMWNLVKVALSMQGHVYGTKYWTGLVKGTWAWSTGNVMTYFNWAPNEPDGAINDRCLVVNATLGYQWQDDNCAAMHHFVCQSGLFVPGSSSPSSSTSSTSRSISSTMPSGVSSTPSSGGGGSSSKPTSSTSSNTTSEAVTNAAPAVASASALSDSALTAIVVVLGLLIIALLLALAYLCYRRQKKAPQKGKVGVYVDARHMART